jgi:ABC-2 type transport system ATP-binding protein
MVQSIAKNYGKKLVLKDVTFEVFQGDIFGVIGMSGSGKTTLFQMMSGMIAWQAGDILVRRDVFFSQKRKDMPNYVSVFKNPVPVKRNFGFASQIPSFYEHLTAEENLLMYGALYGLPKKKARESTSRLLRLVDLTAEKDTLAAELSGGMQRRLDIACSLVHEPKVLFLDEPTSDLDPIMRKQIWALIKEISEKGTTIFIASHILEEVESLCTKIAILHEKHILGYGTLKELKQLFNRGKQVRVEFDAADYDALTKRLRNEKRVDRFVQKGNKLVIFTQRDDESIRKIIKIVEAGKEKLVSMDIADATLTEIFEALTKKQVQDD